MAFYLPVLKPFLVTPNVPFDYSFQYLQGAPTTTLPVPLTGASAVLTITNGTGLITYLTLSSTATYPSTGIYFGGIGTNTPTNGIIDLVIDVADSGAITWKYARYNLSLTTTLYGLQHLMYGSFAVAGFLP